jgi:ureidoglycolate hydrolase
MINDENLLEIREFVGEGYQPLIDFNCWRVAILNYTVEIHPEQIKKFERHTKTDEVFVLLRGKGILFLGEGESKLDDIFPQVMEPGKIYNIKHNVWHSVVLSRDGSVLIVENNNTNEDNTEYSPLLSRHHQVIIDFSRREQPEEWK